MVSPLEVTLLLEVLGPAAVEEIKERVHRLRMNRGWKGPFAVFFDARYTYNVVALEDHGRQTGRFCHVLVHNASPAEIPQSRGMLWAIASRTADRRFVPEPDYLNQLPLRWANILQGDFRKISIPAGDTARLDLCYTVKGSQILHMAVPHGSHGIRTRYGPGIYRVTVRTMAPGAIPTDENFYVIHNGTWDEVRVAEEVPDGIDAILPVDEVKAIMEARERFLARPPEQRPVGRLPQIIVPGFNSSPPSEVGSRGTDRLGSTGTDPVGPGRKRKHDDEDDF